MKKQMLLAAVAGLTLISAHPGPPPAAPIEARSGYPPCSRTVTDRCIQLHERGVRAEANLAENAGAVRAPAPVRAVSRDRDDDIDVAYAGERLQAPRAGHHPVQARAPHASPHHMAHAGSQPGHHPPRAAGATHAAAHPPRAHAVAHAAPAPRTARHVPRRQMAMRVKRAGERG